MVSIKEGEKELLKIYNVEEKQLLVAGYFIEKKKKGVQFQDKDIFKVWSRYFVGDFSLKKKKYKYQKFIYSDESEYGHLTLEDTRYVPKYVIKNHNRLWNDSCMVIHNYLENMTTDDWEKEITTLRKKHERHLKLKCAALGGCVRIQNWYKDQLSTYRVEVWTEEKEFVGNYQRCLEYLEQIKYERKISH